MRVLVTGGAGYIGSVVTEELVKDGHEVVVFDNLRKGHRSAVVAAAKFIQADLFETARLYQTLRENRIEAVIHLAAASLVGESVENPAKYYRENVLAGLKLLDACRDCEIKRIVFSSTAATYGEPEKQPVEESDATAPTNPYGDTKLAFERALHWYEQAYGMQYAALRYFNAAGATEHCGEHHNPETHLIAIVLQVASGEREQVEIYGDDYATRDGTCVRDYIHVVDLARAHILALEATLERSSIYNLGCGGDGYSVKEVIDTASLLTGREIPFRVGKRRTGDPAVLIASSSKIRRELGWSPEKQSLQEIIESAWRWKQKHPFGYQD